MAAGMNLKETVITKGWEPTEEVPERRKASKDKPYFKLFTDFYDSKDDIWVKECGSDAEAKTLTMKLRAYLNSKHYRDAVFAGSFKNFHFKVSQRKEKVYISKEKAERKSIGTLDDSSIL